MSLPSCYKQRGVQDGSLARSMVAPLRAFRSLARCRKKKKMALRAVAAAVGRTRRGGEGEERRERGGRKIGGWSGPFAFRRRSLPSLTRFPLKSQSTSKLRRKLGRLKREEREGFLRFCSLAVFPDTDEEGARTD